MCHTGCVTDMQRKAPEVKMKILHILNDGPSSLSDRVIQEQSKDHQVEVVDLSKNAISYEILIDKVFAFDKVVCW